MDQRYIVPILFIFYGKGELVNFYSKNTDSCFN